MQNSLELSDEDFLKQGGPPPPDPVGEAPAVVDTTAEEKTETPEKTEEKTLPDAEATAEDSSASGSDENKGTKEEPAEETETKPTDAASIAAAAEAATKDPAHTGNREKTAPKEEPAAEAKAFSVPNTFTANGKTIELKDSEEAVRLMQMGANYTRKMQELAPVRKVMLMLKNHNLLDESKLSYLIDLDKKDPAAIQKLIKESGLDPLSIDPTEDPKYIPGGNTVTDEEVGFRSVVEELSSNEAGQESLRLINPRLDETSREVLWKNPEILPVLHSQRETGVYSVIVDEMDRRITLGTLSPKKTPFLQAYQEVGNEMAKAAMETAGGPTEGQSGATNEGTPARPADPKILDTRAAAPKKAVVDNDKVSAASPTRSSPGSARDRINPLAQSDDEFLKQFQGRL